MVENKSDGLSAVLYLLNRMGLHRRLQAFAETTYMGSSQIKKTAEVGNLAQLFPYVISSRSSFCSDVLVQNSVFQQSKCKCYTFEKEGTQRY